MSYEMVLIITVIIIALFIPISAYIAFRKGYELGVKDWNRTHPDEPKTEPERKPHTASTATDKKLKEYETILENIENYDGTESNQKEIK